MIRKILLTILVLYDILPINAQYINGFSLSFIDETISLPFTRYTPIHPGCEFGFTLIKKEKDKSTRQINAYLGGFYHQRVETGLFLRAEYQYAIKIKNIISVDFPVGIGYLHAFYPSDLYVQNHETGEFNKTKQTGRPHALLCAGIGLNYIGFSKFQPFIKQELIIETPFANTFPFIPHSFFKLGVYINTK